MLNIHDTTNAKKTARKLEKYLETQGITLPHGKALDAIASMMGHANWASVKSGVENSLRRHEQRHIAENQDTQYGAECILVAHTGFQLRYDLQDACTTYVRVCDPLGREIAYWDSDEWANEPTVIMAALLSAAGRMTAPNQPQEAPRMPTLKDVDFKKVSNVHVGVAPYMFVLYDAEHQLMLDYLQSGKSVEAEDDVVVFQLQWFDDNQFLETRDVYLSEALAMQWSEDDAGFRDSKGHIWTFLIETTFGRANMATAS